MAIFFPTLKPCMIGISRNAAASSTLRPLPKPDLAKGDIVFDIDQSRGNHMTTPGKTLLAAAFILLSAPLFAGSARANDGVILYYPETGRLVMGQLGKDGMETGLKHAKELTGPVIIFSQGGKAYIVEDAMAKMPNGESMIDFLDKTTYGAR
jgi:hypothetical protein